MICHVPLEGFTNLHSEIAPNLPKAMDAFRSVANSPWAFNSDIRAKQVKKEIRKKGCYSSRTIGGKVSFIQAFLTAGKKRYLVVSMQSSSAPIRTNFGLEVPIPKYDSNALVARLSV